MARRLLSAVKEVLLAGLSVAVRTSTPCASAGRVLTTARVGLVGEVLAEEACLLIYVRPLVELAVFNHWKVTVARVILFSATGRCVEQNEACISTAADILNPLFDNRDDAVGANVSLDRLLCHARVTLCSALQGRIQVACHSIYQLKFHKLCPIFESRRQL